MRWGTSSYRLAMNKQVDVLEVIANAHETVDKALGLDLDSGKKQQLATTKQALKDAHMKVRHYNEYFGVKLVATVPAGEPMRSSADLSQEESAATPPDSEPEQPSTEPA